MPGQRHRAKLDEIIIAIMTLLVIGGVIALGYVQNVSSENRALLVMALSLGIIGCFAGLVSLGTLRRGLRKRVWQKAMGVWNESSQAKNLPKFVMMDNLSESALRQLAIRSYSRMGYRILNRDEKEAYIQLINPDGKIELIVCKQQPDLIKLHHVYSLELEMKRTKASRGFFWAPAGFSSEVIDWVLHRPIILTDKHEIARFVDCAQVNGSRFLEH